jgi:hemerythrin
MKKLEWKEEYSVGIEKIDRQHQHLFEITNKLIAQAGSPEDSQLASETLTEMVNYAREHFSTEEKLMREYDYPELDSQRNQHDYFINTTAELAISFMDDSNTTGDEILEFLKLWLTTHILKYDMKYKAFFKAKMSPVAEHSI